jgi:uncharacterized membrane protein YfcA
VTVVQGALGVVVGFVSGVLSGLFGVGGGVVTTPAVNVLLGGTAIQAVATPLPVILPTSLVGARAYARAGEVSFRAARWGALPGIVGAVAGALLTQLVNAHLLLVVTAVLLAWTASRVMRARRSPTSWRLGATPGWKYAVIGFGAGFVSGLLGVGGGIVMVPAFAVLIGMPLKRALGTSLVVIAVLVIPGTVVHAVLGHIDWSIFLVLVLGVMPGAWLGSKFAIGAAEHTLRILVGTFLLAIALLYGVRESVALLGGGG